MVSDISLEAHRERSESSSFAGIKAIVFDLDGTLYVNDGVARQIAASASGYIASLRGIDPVGACSLIEDTRKRLSAASGRATTLTVVCLELGGDIRNLHRHFAAEVKPELFLGPDENLTELLEKLAKSLDLYIYTNNNRVLCERVMKSLGISGFFREAFTVEDYWRPKPDLSALQDIFARIGRAPGECLFVGDRYDVDLRLPATLGSPVFLVRNTQELMSLMRDIVENPIDIGK